MFAILCKSTTLCVSGMLFESQYDQGSHGQGKVRDFRIFFKVRELSGNLDFGQGNLQFIKKSGKSQGIFVIILKFFLGIIL